MHSRQKPPHRSGRGEHAAANKGELSSLFRSTVQIVTHFHKARPLHYQPTGQSTRAPAAAAAPWRPCNQGTSAAVAHAAVTEPAAAGPKRGGHPPSLHPASSAPPPNIPHTNLPSQTPTHMIAFLGCSTPCRCIKVMQNTCANNEKMIKASTQLQHAAACMTAWPWPVERLCKNAERRP